MDHVLGCEIDVVTPAGTNKKFMNTSEYFGVTDAEVKAAHEILRKLDAEHSKHHLATKAVAGEATFILRTWSKIDGKLETGVGGTYDGLSADAVLAIIDSSLKTALPELLKISQAHLHRPI
jgi:hypothetical protein